MATTIGILIALLSLVILVLPFIKSRMRVTSGDVALRLDETSRLRQAMYDNIRTLRQDYDIGNISEDDYKSQLDGYRRQAALALMEEDRLRGWKEEESLMESNDGNDPSLICYECGAPVALDDKVCLNCGTEQLP